MKLPTDKDIYLQFTLEDGYRCAVFLSEVIGIAEATEHTATTIITRSAPLFVQESIDEVATMMGIKLTEPEEEESEEEEEEENTVDQNPEPDSLNDIFRYMDTRQLEALALLIKNRLAKEIKVVH